MSIVDATDTIVAALETIEGLSVYTETSTQPNPPCVYVTPPALTWSAYNAVTADQAVFSLFLVVASNGYSVSTVEPLIESIAAALAGLPDSALTRAAPSSWGAGGAQLPAYLFTLEAGL